MIKNKKQSKNNKDKRKLLFLLPVAALLLGVGSYLYAQRNSDNNSTAQIANANTQPQGAINFGPATEQDKQAVDNNTKETVTKGSPEPVAPPPAGSDGRRTIKPVITYAGQYGTQVEVGGYVPGVFEDGGTCKATFTNVGTSFSKSVKAIRSANSTDCPVMMASNGEFSPKGNWSVVVSYESSTSAGISDSNSIEVK